MSEKHKSLLQNETRKRRIILGCSVSGAAVLMAGGGIGVGYAIWHSKSKDKVDELGFVDASPYAARYSFWVGTVPKFEAPNKPGPCRTSPSSYYVDDQEYKVVGGTLPIGLHFTEVNGFPWFAADDFRGPQQVGTGEVTVQVTSPSWPGISTNISFGWTVNPAIIEQTDFIDAFGYSKNYNFFSNSDINVKDMPKPNTPTIIYTYPSAMNVNNFFYTIDQAASSLPNGVIWDCDPSKEQTTLPWLEGEPNGSGSNAGSVTIHCKSPSWPDIDATFTFNWTVITKNISATPTKLVDAFSYLSDYDIYEMDVDQTNMPVIPQTIYTDVGDEVTSGFSYSVVSGTLPEGLAFTYGNNGYPWFVGVAKEGSKGDYPITVEVAATVRETSLTEQFAFVIHVHEKIVKQYGFANAFPYEPSYIFLTSKDAFTFMSPLSKPSMIRTNPSGFEVTDHVYSIVNGSQIPTGCAWTNLDGLPVISGHPTVYDESGTAIVRVTSPSFPDVKQDFNIWWMVTKEKTSK